MCFGYCGQVGEREEKGYRVVMKTKVAIVKCLSYDLDRLKVALEKCINLLGGWEELFKKQDSVLIKPNLIRCLGPESGVNTHPLFVRTIVQMLEQRVGCKISVGDSSGDRFKDIEEIWKVSGMTQAVEGTTAGLVKFNRAVNVELPKGKILKSLLVARPVLENSVLISVPKMKTHDVTMITAGVKNLMGTVPGLFKFNLHKKSPHPLGMSEIFADILSVVKPMLTIMDAIVSMEGEGPIAGRLRHTGFILASFDPVALDVVASTLMGIDPCCVSTISACAKRGLGAGSLAQIEVVGEKISDFSIPKFLLPKDSAVSAIPYGLARFIGKLISVRPYLDKNRCDNCLLCKENCPFAAISLKSSLISYDYSLCSQCLCCYELCPRRAIRIKKNFAAKFYFAKKKDFISFIRFIKR